MKILYAMRQMNVATFAVAVGKVAAVAYGLISSNLLEERLRLVKAMYYLADYIFPVAFHDCKA